MRDLLLAAIIVVAAVMALRRPWIGVMLWTWLSLMNPHRYTYGFAYEGPWAQIAAICTLIGMLVSRDRRDSPIKGSPVAIFVVFVAWITLSWLLGLDPSGDYYQWIKVMKIDFMLLIALALLHSKQHVFALTWVCAMSLALLGAKGGLFTITSGGGHRVWGPPGSFIEDNNEFALSLVMTIPLLRFLQMQLSGTLARHGMTLLMILLAASALGSQSRGALLAITAMAIVLWWRGRSRIVGGVVIVASAVALLAFMPASWFSRMDTIQTYEEDRSAIGRFSAWWVAWGIAKSHLFGVGFNAARGALFQMYSPYPELGTPAAHSIYFQVMGNHGFVGLLIFVGLWATTMWWAGRVRKEAKGIPQARWAIDLANMCQVSLIGYAVGGAFLSLAYFDLPYNIMVLIVVTRLWVRSRAWEREPVYQPGWFSIPGLAGPQRQPDPGPAQRPRVSASGPGSPASSAGPRS